MMNSMNQLRVNKCRIKKKLLDKYKVDEDTLNKKVENGANHSKQIIEPPHENVYFDVHDELDDFYDIYYQDGSDIEENVHENVNNDVYNDDDDEELNYYSIDELSENEFSGENNDNELFDCIAQDETQTTVLNEVQEIKEWAIKYQIKHQHLDKLLAILRYRLLPELPKTSVTFLETGLANYDIKVIDIDGEISEFVYFQMKKSLEKYINVDIFKSETIKIQINVDGLPLYRGSQYNFWTILYKIHHDPDIFKPLPAAIYYGVGKPKCLNAFFDDFIDEVNELLKNGLTISERHFTFEIKCFICDTPARSFSKSTKGHTGFFACERCMAKGKRINNRTVYSIEGENRCEKEFRKQTQGDHHVGTSPLVNIKPHINMTSDFVLDFMHLCCLGIMKKLLNYWLTNSKSAKLGPTSKKVLSSRMESLRKQVPFEFQRKPRSTKSYTHWKATEFRFFLLYCGPLVLRGILPKLLYKHFLLFHVACRILCSKNLAVKYCDVAKEYLQRFFYLTKHLYGKSSQVMNFHNVLHLADDVKNMNCHLSLITAFPFENLLGKIKRLLRSGNKPLAQVCRRLHEEYHVLGKADSLPKIITIFKRDKKYPNHVTKLQYKDYILTTKYPNNIVLIGADVCFFIDKIAISDKTLSPENIELHGTELKMRKCVFKYPCESKFCSMWEFVNKNRKIESTVHLADVQSKMMLLSIDEVPTKMEVIISLLH